MGQAAELGAAAPVLTGLVCFDRHAVRTPGDEVDLAGQLRHPEGVDDIGGGEHQLHRLTDRDVDLVGRDDPAGTRVADPPPVLARLDLDGRSEEHTSELQSLMRISY